MIIKPKPIDVETHVISTKPIMCKMDVNGVIEYANEYFVELTGYTEGELMGETIEMINHPKMPKAINNLMWSLVQKKQKVNGVTKYISKLGKYYWLQIKLDFKVDLITREISNIYLYATNTERNKVIALDKIYTKINKIEKESGQQVSTNYFMNYLESLNKNYNDFIESYLKV